MGRKILKISLEKTAWLCLFGSGDIPSWGWDHDSQWGCTSPFKILGTWSCGQEGLCTGTPCASVVPFPGLGDLQPITPILVILQLVYSNGLHTNSLKDHFGRHPKSAAGLECNAISRIWQQGEWRPGLWDALIASWLWVLEFRVLAIIFKFLHAIGLGYLRDWLSLPIWFGLAERVHSGPILWDLGKFPILLQFLPLGMIKLQRVRWLPPFYHSGNCWRFGCSPRHWEQSDCGVPFLPCFVLLYFDLVFTFWSIVFFNTLVLL